MLKGDVKCMTDEWFFEIYVTDFFTTTIVKFKSEHNGNLIESLFT